MSKLGPITNGTARVTPNGHTISVKTKFGGRQVVAEAVEVFMDRAERMANAALYADAHNTANRTGKLPSELEAERDELLAALKQVTDLVSGVRNQGKMPDGLDRAINIGRALIAKSTGK